MDEKNSKPTWKMTLLMAGGVGSFATLMSGSTLFGGIMTGLSIAVFSAINLKNEVKQKDEEERLESLERLMDPTYNKNSFTNGSDVIHVNEILLAKKNKIVYSFYYKGRLNSFMTLIFDKALGEITKEELHIPVFGETKERYSKVIKQIKKELLKRNNGIVQEKNIDEKLENDEIIKKAKEILSFAEKVANDIYIGNIETKHLLTEGIRHDVKRLLSSYLSFSEETKAKNKDEMMETLNVIQKKVINIYHEVENGKEQEMNKIKTVIRERYR